MALASTSSRDQMMIDTSILSLILDYDQAFSALLQSTMTSQDIEQGRLNLAKLRHTTAQLNINQLSEPSPPSSQPHSSASSLFDQPEVPKSPIVPDSQHLGLLPASEPAPKPLSTSQTTRTRILVLSLPALRTLNIMMCFMFQFRIPLWRTRCSRIGDTHRFDPLSATS
jgi:hypothetical protein